MFTIYKLRTHHVIDFAAEELKKYLRMMMLQCPEIDILYDPDAKEGFRLGLAEDFGLTLEATDLTLDDEVIIDTDENGGILAGSNPRSVLFAVYRYLKLNGCRFFAAGVDGEYIPRKDVTAQKYHHLADHRMRGYTIEGRPSMQNVMAYIDYHAKQERNYFGAFTPFVYMGRWYMHDQLEASREPEPVDFETVEQWHRAIESECLKRGQILTGGSHEIVPQVLGIDPKDRELYRAGKLEATEEMKEKMALVDGKRDLYHKDPFNTNFCMSRADLRSRYADVIMDLCRKNRHLLSVSCSLADLPRNHCECEECQKLYPTDFMVMMLNEIDQRLTAEGLDTRLSFSTYVDKQFAPKQEKLKNPGRFSMSYPPISRTYAASITEDSVYPELQPYVRNAWKSPRSVEEGMAYFRKWQEIFPGNCTTYEYHFWVHQYRDPGLMAMSRRIYEDIQSLKICRMNGIMEDGSNKSFFPHGFMSYVYSETLVHRDVDYEELKKDYFSNAYGEDWEKAVAYFEKMSRLFDHAFMCGDLSVDTSKSIFYDPARVENFEAVKQLAQEGRVLSATHRPMPHNRMQAIHWQLMQYHAAWCELVATAMSAKCRGEDKEAQKIWKRSVNEFSKHDVLLDPWFDMSLAAVSIARVVAAMQPIKDF